MTKEDIKILKSFSNNIIERAGQWLDEDDEDEMEDFENREKSARYLINLFISWNITSDEMDKLEGLVKGFFDTVMNCEENDINVDADNADDPDYLPLLESIERDYNEFKALLK